MSQAFHESALNEKPSATGWAIARAKTSVIAIYEDAKRAAYSRGECKGIGQIGADPRRGSPSQPEAGRSTNMLITFQLLGKVET